ncbi:MAG: acetoin:2,6-dichlorophenolindophenol oxidoreductase subunit beta [Thermoanaerobacteraceae bacterium]|jgi:pyruvate dehydrogenase E1 component beta subunit|uniref:Alpha-ketoacid dehydrogenase subunit beta n=1 Tax=Biomaibacter acetigenes TaxID=2316383 RepID=A0A3G2R736_9FIRM|nr:alpha-ketoacid dehydrogenase subunit beta [Biomaibacter acetigenes]AYO30908.1 alpha-ketoacid dehydrogenase subunit beta [Biomaibacter acetigenes]MDK2879413.1 acetoin:2,6-dichlorophenolindophenol oxidoreductase subunit beta [Thermoanaerobacteraceae bacterium]RKL61974.1 alpha-ketoacid dehydrogenase subunit beta [Thermoanaerobacteraceae bacterium SP2]
MPEKLYIEALREGLREEMLRDENVFIIGEDVGLYGGAFGVTKGLFQEFGEDRVKDTPISEAAIAGAAVGAALCGMRPVAEIMFFDFFTIAMDQLVNQGAKNRYMFGGKAKVPMVIRGPMGCGTGAAAQHSQSFPAVFAHFPGLKVVMPSTPYDVKGLIKASIRDDNPVVFAEHKLLYKVKGEVPEEDYIVPLGKADVKRKGKDITVVAGSIMVIRALEAAKQLEKEGIDVEVVDPRTLKPLDMDTIVNSVKKTGRVVIVEDDPISFGWGAEVAAGIASSSAFDYLDAPIKRLAGLDIPIPYNPNLEKHAVPQVEDIIKGIKETLG